MGKVLVVLLVLCGCGGSRGGGTDDRSSPDEAYAVLDALEACEEHKESIFDGPNLDAVATSVACQKCDPGYDPDFWLPCNRYDSAAHVTDPEPPTDDLLTACDDLHAVVDCEAQ